MTLETNTYDIHDRIQRRADIIAGPLKIAAYRLRDPKTDEWGKLQFHMTYDNMVVALMGEEAAKLFTLFVKDTMEREYPPVPKGDPLAPNDAYDKVARDALNGSPLDLSKAEGDGNT